MESDAQSAKWLFIIWGGFRAYTISVAHFRGQECNSFQIWHFYRNALLTQHHYVIGF
jgi:hypothetical protein